MTQQKRVAAIHDISCLGKCSLTVALPILSTAGIETAVIPTAVLSTHTGGFTGYTYRDLTADILPIVEHWKSLSLHFDAIYTGFLGSFDQIDIVSHVFDKLASADTLLFVDPVMGDLGKLYTVFPNTFPIGMRKLVQKSNFLIPNMTEALLLLDRPYQPGPYTEVFIHDVLHALGDLGPSQIVLTGVHFDETHLGAAAYDRSSGQIDIVLSDLIPGHYHGTGDIFSSALLSGVLNAKSLVRSVEIAVRYTTGAIQRTHQAQTDPRHGVNFEAGAAELLTLLQS